MRHLMKLLLCQYLTIVGWTILAVWSLHVGTQFSNSTSSSWTSWLRTNSSSSTTSATTAIQNHNSSSANHSSSATPEAYDAKTRPRSSQLQQSSADPTDFVSRAPSGSDNVEKDNLYNSYQKLPKWIQEYLVWHQNQRYNLTVNNWSNCRYLILRCYAKDRECGGASDRLQSLPYVLYLAHSSQRLLLIHWTRPALLQEFLLPPTQAQDGTVPVLDWTIPMFLVPHLPNGRRPHIFSRQASDDHVQLVQNTLLTIIEMYDQSKDHGATFYNQLQQLQLQQPNKPIISFDQVMGFLWPLIFQPSSPVAQIIQQQQKELGLHVPTTLTSVGFDTTQSRQIRRQEREVLQLNSSLQPRVVEYASLHIRSRYWHDHSQRYDAIENAVRCAIQLALGQQQPGSNATGTMNHGRSIYVSTDSINVTQYAVEYGNLLLSRRPSLESSKQQPQPSQYLVVARASYQNPLHLDRGSNYLKEKRTSRSRHAVLDWDQYNSSMYYDTFVDLYLLAGAICTAYGTGGYGQWANLLSRDPSCAIDYRTTQCPEPWQ